MPDLLLDLGDDIHLAQGPQAGPNVCIAFGVHGNERAPIDAGLALAERLEKADVRIVKGSLLLVFGNPAAARQDRRFTEDGVDLNRCFHPDVLARAPTLLEERRAATIADAIETHDITTLVDFHCTVEPGERFVMHHPPVADPGHHAVTRLLAAETVLADPGLAFGGVSLDEHLSTRGHVGVCYETGWIGDPANTPDGVREEMENLLRGLGLVDGEFRAYDGKRTLELESALRCEAAGFTWEQGIGRNLQDLKAGTTLGAYGDGRKVALEKDATLIFPKKKPELVQVGSPLVYLARRVAAG